MKNAKLVLLALLSLSIVAGLSGREMPNFNLIDMHDRNYELYRAKGKVVVLFFTGTGCPIARKSSGKLKKLTELYEAKGVDVWIVNSYPNEDKRDIIKEMRELGLRNSIYLLDRKQAVALSLRS